MMQEGHSGEQEEILRGEAEERSEQEPEETPEVRFERIVERGAVIVKEIAQYAEASGEDADFEKSRTSAVEALGEEEIVAIEDKAQIPERLELVDEQKRALAGNTLEKVRALADLLLSDELNDDERNALYERLNLEKLGSGSYFKAHEIPGTEWVFKPLKLNYLHSREDAVRILGAQSEEERNLREHFGDMIAETHFVVPEAYQDVFEEGSARAEQGKFPYGLGDFAKILAEKRLDPDFTPKDVQGAERENRFDRVVGPIGKFLKETSIYRQEAAGAVLQERIHGITFAELLDQHPDRQSLESLENWEELQQSVRSFVDAVRSFNQEYAFCYLGFETDNVLVEVDPETGEPAGTIKIPDINYTKRFSERLRAKVVDKLDASYLTPLEEKFGLQPVEEGETTT